MARLSPSFRGRKGRQIERLLVKKLKEGGYEVMRSAASRGLFDVAAFGVCDDLLIQVKANVPPAAAELRRIERFWHLSAMERRILLWVRVDGTNQHDPGRWEVYMLIRWAGWSALYQGDRKTIKGGAESAAIWIELKEEEWL